MTGLLVFSPVATMILVAVLEKRWQRMVALAASILLLFGAFDVVGNEIKKAVWAQCGIRIGLPMGHLLVELDDEINAGRLPEAAAQVAYMAENWNRVGVAPWMKSVEDLRAEFHAQKTQAPNDP